MPREQQLRSRVKIFAWLFIFGLFISGATAIPLTQEVDWLVNITGVNPAALPSASPGQRWDVWLLKVQAALHSVGEQHPFLLYGTDWLAFGHFVIAIAFIGALRDPARNRWLFDFGLTACALVIPFAFVLGGIRGIPVWWRLIDCSFGVIGFVPLWFCRGWVQELEQIQSGASGHERA